MRRYRVQVVDVDGVVHDTRRFFVRSFAVDYARMISSPFHDVTVDRYKRGDWVERVETFRHVPPEDTKSILEQSTSTEDFFRRMKEASS